MNVNGYKKSGTLIFSRDDGTKVIGYGVIYTSGIKKVRLHVEKGNQLYAPIELTMDELKNKIFAIQKFDAQFSPVEISEILQSIDTKFSHLQPIKAIENLGWQRNQDSNIIGYAGSAVFDSDGNEVLKDPYADLPDSNGSYSMKIQAYLSGHTKRQIIFLWSLSSVICGLLNRTIWLNLCALSSKGKTISAQLAQSSFCGINYSALCKTWASTELALVKSMDGLNGIPVLIDDTQLSKIKSYQKIIYELTNGKSVLRLVKGNQLAKGYNWATSVISTSENSMLDTCNKEDEGVLPRLMEMEIYQDELFDDAQQANNVKRFVKTHYGNVAPKFVQYILKNSYVNKIENLYTSEIHSIRKSVTDHDTVLQRCIESIAIITLTAKIAKKALSLQFDILDVQGLLLDLCRQNIDDYRAEKSSNIILTQIYPQLVKLAKENYPSHHRDNYIVISSKLLKPFLSINNTKLTQKKIITTLFENGLAYRQDSYTYTFDKKSVRGFALIIKPESGDSNE